MHVLIGVDASANSFEAVRLASRLLSPERDEIRLYYSPPDVNISGPDELVPDLTRRARKALSESVFAEARLHVPPGMHPRLTTVEGSDPPRQGLIEAANEWPADLMVVGARGLGAVERLLLGSVSQWITSHSPAPVLVVRGLRRAPEIESLDVLLASDGSPVIDEAASLLGRLTWPAGSRGRLLTVTESMYAGEIPEWLKNQAREADTEAMSQVWEREYASEKEAACTRLRALRTRLPKPFEGEEPIVREGNPADQILEFVAAEPIDLVVVGARASGMWERLMLGSTSSTVLSHAPCSVLVVREKEA
jgi:nucleotide-binding universal stress UspA family protein